VAGEGEGRQIWPLYLTYVYEDRTIKLVLSWGKGVRENDGGDESN
jgi:hypothetical protein